MQQGTLARHSEIRNAALVYGEGCILVRLCFVDCGVGCRIDDQIRFYGSEGRLHGGGVGDIEIGAGQSD